MFGKAKIHNFSFWKTQNSEFQCLEKPYFTFLMFGKANFQNSIVWKRQNFQF